MEVEVLMNKELEITPFPEEVEISIKLIGPEKDRQPVKFLMKKVKLDGDGAYHEKAKKNTKVNLGGPSKTKKKHTDLSTETCLKLELRKRRKSNYNYF